MTVYGAMHARRSSNASSEASDGSDHSRSTAPTDYSYKPSLRRFDIDISQAKAAKGQAEDFCDERDYRQSVDSFASTIASEIDLEEDALEYDEPPEVQYDRYEPCTPSAYVSTPSEFAEYFPSTRRLCIRHDDTVDGNMNLRVDTETHTESGRKIDLTLFHLRMHDLKRREFSFRRYGRDSGREICHSSRKYTKPVSQRRPAFQRSMSSALASLRSMTGDKSSIRSPKRYDSGYGSVKDSEGSEAADEPSRLSNSKNLPIPTNTTMLDFSNYAHVELKRRGTKSSKRYEFSYWGTTYSWRRSARKCGSSTDISYRLYSPTSSDPLAQIVPEPISPYEAEEEERKGGWIPRSSMWISDSKLISALTDVAE